MYDQDLEAAIKAGADLNYDPAKEKNFLYLDKNTKERLDKEIEEIKQAIRANEDPKVQESLKTAYSLLLELRSFYRESVYDQSTIPQSTKNV